MNMKKIVSFIFVISFISASYAQTGSKTALLLVDIQNFYFPGGKSALVEPEKAADNAAILLKSFRENNQIVVHVRHNFEPGGEIHKKVSPLAKEKVISKDEVNAFLNTDLLYYLEVRQIDTLVICGMQTHMCAEAATRAAHDLGFVCYFVEDACATKDLKFNEYVIKSIDVHKSTLSSLSPYAKVITINEYFDITK